MVGTGQWQQNSNAALINRIITEVKSAGLCFLPLLIFNAALLYISQRKKRADLKSFRQQWGYLQEG